MSTGGSPTNHDVILTRRFPDPPAALFDAFTDPDSLRHWWCPLGFRTVAIRFPAGEGEHYRVELLADDGTRWVHEGRFLVVQPPTKLLYTWQWTEGPMSRVETLVELSFEADGAGGTLLRVTHRRFVSTDESVAHREGWAGALDRLAPRLEASTRS